MPSISFGENKPTISISTPLSVWILSPIFRPFFSARSLLIIPLFSSSGIICRPSSSVSCPEVKRVSSSLFHVLKIFEDLRNSSSTGILPVNSCREGKAASPSTVALHSLIPSIPRICFTSSGLICWVEYISVPPSTSSIFK